MSLPFEKCAIALVFGIKPVGLFRRNDPLERQSAGILGHLGDLPSPRPRIFDLAVTLKKSLKREGCRAAGVPNMGRAAPSLGYKGAFGARDGRRRRAIPTFWKGERCAQHDLPKVVEVSSFGGRDAYSNSGRWCSPRRLHTLKAESPSSSRVRREFKSSK